MLHAPDRHEALAGPGWDPAAAREGLRELCQGLIDEFQPGQGWRVHALDVDGDVPTGGYKGLYLGRAGVLWALHHLAREAGAPVMPDLHDAVAAAHADFLQSPDVGEPVPSYYLGEAGILLLGWAITGSAAMADRLHEVVQANIPNPTNEALWAAPGTMLAAWHLWGATGEARWAELFRANARHVLGTLAHDEALGCHLWTQDMYGRVVQYYGAGHGFAGNLFPLLKGLDLLDPADREAVLAHGAHTLLRLAQREGDQVNWPPGHYPPRAGSPRFLMQWCHGAPGIVTALADYPVGHSPELDAALAGGGEAIWAAGPLVKGAGLCHGTAGNAAALLQLHQRTSQARWLHRARALAMHALAQSRAMRQAHGHWRASLWTGDAGVAMVLWQCLEGRAGMAGLDLV